jgi:aspartyl-tRNA(Asn)/glutamyl-tRNA(Gln) amidotransferase subunit A
MAGKDELDSTSSSIPLNEKIHVSEKLRIGVISECLDHPGLDEEVKSFLNQKINDLKLAGHNVVDLSFPYLDYLVPAYYVLTTAEASSNLARFDGVHYGYRSPNAVGVEQTYVNSRSEGFGAEVKRRIMAGTFVLSHEFYDAYYTKAQKVRRILKDRTDEIFKKVDLLIMPTTPSTAFEMNAIKDTIQMYLQDIFTVHANLTGNPAMSIPLGNHSNGLPFGIQIMTDRFKEGELFEYAEIIEKI